MVCANSQMVQKKKIMHECLCCARMYLVRDGIGREIEMEKMKKKCDKY